MASYLCLTMRFLLPYFHGRTEGGRPEWPPSPLRSFQAIVEAAARKWPDASFQQVAAPLLRWLERQPAPRIIAPSAQPAQATYRLYVPDNVGDKVARSWVLGRDADIADYRTEKDVHPINLHTGDAVHYLYLLPSENCPHYDSLVSAMRSVTHLGWGVDMVAGNASILTEDEARQLPGERWLPAEGKANDGYRLPVEGTAVDLLQRHEAFLNRLSPDGFKPVPPLSAFRVVGYRRATDLQQLQFAAFTILRPNASAMRAFNAPRRTRDVAGMMRHAVARAAAAAGWPQERINVFVHGKTPDGRAPASGIKSPDRFMYLPLPTINKALNRVEPIRRVMLAAPPHCTEDISWAMRALSGADLIDESGNPAGLLTVLPKSDWVLGNYVATARQWTTVTPLILPGHDSRDARKTLKLLRSACAQAGLCAELCQAMEIEWRGVGYYAGVDLASRYLPPENLDNRPRFHVMLRFPQAISGPLALGSGRFRGFGTFVGCRGTE